MEKITFMTSLLTFYLKGEISAEQDFLRMKRPNTILTFIPLGTKKINVPINQISTVGTNFKLLLKDFIVGLIILIFGINFIAKIPGLGIFLFLLAAFMIINSFQTQLVVTTTSGAGYVLYFLIFEKKKAELAEESINSMIAGRLHDTNVRTNTENQTAAINSAQAANTQAIIDAINSNKN